MSPSSTLLPLVVFDVLSMSRAAPNVPNANPIIFLEVSFSFNTHAARTITNKGVASISKDACVAKVKDNPFKKSNWLSAIPVSAQSINRTISFGWIFCLTGLKKNKTHNNKDATAARTRFKPNGCMSPLFIRCFTSEKFIAKKRFVPAKAKCAFVEGCKEVIFANIVNQHKKNRFLRDAKKRFYLLTQNTVFMKSL